MRYLLIAMGLVLAGAGEVPAIETGVPLLIAQDAARGCCSCRAVAACG